MNRGPHVLALSAVAPRKADQCRTTSPSSSGPGLRPFKAATRVRIPLGIYCVFNDLSRRHDFRAPRPAAARLLAGRWLSGPRPKPLLARAADLDACANPRAKQRRPAGRARTLPLEG